MRAVLIVLRVLLGIGGGYAASAAISAALAVSLYRVAGIDRSEATVLCALLGFALYLFALLWSLSTSQPGRVALVFAGSSALGYGIVRALSPSGRLTSFAAECLERLGGSVA